jgi:hypothetical protein
LILVSLDMLQGLVLCDRLFIRGPDRAGCAHEHLEVSERRLRPVKLLASFALPTKPAA